MLICFFWGQDVCVVNLSGLIRPFLQKLVVKKLQEKAKNTKKVDQITQISPLESVKI